MPNRYVCSALEELRSSLSKHFTFIDVLVPEASNEEYAMVRRQLHLECLVEEIQTYVSRMEASLGDTWDMHYQQELRTELKLKRRALSKKVAKLEARVEELELQIEEMEEEGTEEDYEND